MRVRDICQLNNNTCEQFDEQTEDCIDDRKSQNTALLLSAFLSATGAANFYIGQYALGAFISVRKSAMHIVGIDKCACTCEVDKGCRYFYSSGK